MRISDWSSDVCSSDLATAPAVFDGSASGLRLRRCPQIFLHDVGREPDTFERHPRGSGDPVTFAFIAGKSKADPSLRSGCRLLAPRYARLAIVTSTTATTGRRRRRGPSTS